MPTAASTSSNAKIDRKAGALTLIAGAGQLPIEAAEELEAARSGIEAIGFKGITDPGLEEVVTRLSWLDLGQLEALAHRLSETNTERLLLVGKVSKSLLLSGRAASSAAPISLDATALELLASSVDRSDEAVLGLIARWIEGQGYEVVDQNVVLTEMLAPKGPLTRAKPSEAALRDLRVGWPVAESLGRSGVGQCVVMKDGAVLAVEAIEGTDETIRRAGRLGGPGATVIKCLRADQDRRFDLPTVGPDTIRVMADSGVAALAIEAGAALILDRERFFADADQAGIAIWGFAAERSAG